MKHGKVRDLREDHDLTQRDVAQLLGVKRSTYTMWELGDVNFPIEKLVKLAQILHTNLEYMLGISIDKRAIQYPDDIDIGFIGQQLRKQRLKLNKTQSDFAKTLKIHQSTYSYYEDGRTRIPTEKLILLSITYRISLNEICGAKSTKVPVFH